MDQNNEGQSGEAIDGWIEWNTISEPGAYVTKEGSLIRFFPESLREGHSPLVKIESKLDTRIKKIASNPEIGKDDARRLAMRAGTPINF
jgi:hypothetical protein